MPTVKDLRIELGDAFERVLPSALPSARLGEVITVYAHHAPSRAPGTVRLVGSLEEAPFSLESRLESSREPSNASAIARGCAAATIARLEASERPDTKAIVALSREHHVLSRHTALLVLESDAMFRAFGVERLAANNPVPRDEIRAHRSVEEGPGVAAGATAGSAGASLGVGGGACTLAPRLPHSGSKPSNHTRHAS